MSRRSHPSWVRGLKLAVAHYLPTYCVAPLVGAWIETVEDGCLYAEHGVAPLVGAWIETSNVS